ncbi:hemolysin family protein [Virgibacillus sp. LDC1]|uniref:hemolysin family protein n=1 Tax=Paenibacillus TaxID=44249 RepID=UPI000C279F9E|nr:MULTISPECIES: hemolysin family protein [Paenibacillus]MCV4235343.1 hemolysin family protein [Virgibacillus sp. LDC1]MEC0253746.1 hemolysin family protein [Paenibacillus lautus]MEC0310109.1 hemolysin family protein [Paenibacillus lautus]PJN49236.1 Magnesium and cobalt efflux protein CorC [Paenibacillus sp. GM2FR]
MEDSIGLNLFLVAVLIAATAFFVMTEFAIIRLRPSRVDQLVMEGRKGALAVKKVTSNLDGYLSACQLGITITALGLGWLGEPTIEKILHPVFDSFSIPAAIASLISFLLAFIIMTYIHVVIGELAPKTIAINKAEAVSFICATPIIWFNRIMYPFIWLLNGSANKIVRLFGMHPASEHEEAHSEEELRMILSDSYESGKINQAEYGYVSRIFAFDDMLAKEIMVPRTDMICLYVDKPLAANLQIIKREQYTRFPVVRGDKDQIVGMVNTKQFFLEFDDNSNIDLTKLIHPAMTVSEAIPIKKLLRKMQQEGTHMAILIDEYGGTSGMITIEDILEEIVGEIRDEFDEDEERELTQPEPNRIIADGKVSINRINDLLHTDLSTDDLDTIGGWLYGHNSELAKGDTWSYGDLTFTVIEKKTHRYTKLQIVKETPETAAEEAAAVAAASENNE